MWREAPEGLDCNPGSFDIQPMQAYLKRSVRVPASMILLMKMKKGRYRMEEEHLEVIRKLIAMCEYVAVCDSINHMRARGCPKCGVVHMGSSTNLAQYIRCADRKTGAERLIKLNFELEQLRGEEREQVEKLTQLAASVEVSKVAVFDKLLRHFQMWWPSKLAINICRHHEMRTDWSRFYYRIRRLVRMKREVDSVPIDEVDMEQLSYKYADLKRELEDYVNVKLNVRVNSSLKVARVFLAKLRAAVGRARQRQWRHEERQRLLALERERLAEKRVKEKEMRMLCKRLEIMEKEKKKWLCVRPECHHRRFLSRDRFETHMSHHAKADAERKGQLAALSEIKGERESMAKSMLARIAASREVLVTRLPALSDLRVKESDASDIKPLSWTELPHIRQMGAYLSKALYHLELLSKREGVDVPLHITLDRPMTRLGTMAECEGVISLSTALASSSSLSSSSGVGLLLSTKSTGDPLVSGDEVAPASSPVLPRRPVAPPIAKIHCMVYSAMGEDGSATENVNVVDNSSAWGTYVVSTGNARRVASRYSTGTKLNAGDLLCLGVGLDAPAELTATQASSAVVVFRVCCLDQEAFAENKRS